MVHADPVARMEANRARILRALYTILIHGCRNRPAGQVPKTRFRTWWVVVGWPVELAASLLNQPVALDFTAVFKQFEEEDTTARAVAVALRILQVHFGSVERGTAPDAGKWFMPRHIRTILEDGERARAEQQANHAGQAQIDTANALLEVYEGLAEKRNRSPSSRAFGKVLSGIVDRPVELDDAAVGVLRAKLLHGEKHFCIETITPHSPEKMLVPESAGSVEGGFQIHPDTTEKAFEGGEVAEMPKEVGFKSTPESAFGGRNQNISEEVIRPPLQIHSEKEQPSPEQVAEQEVRSATTETISPSPRRNGGEARTAAKPRKTKGGSPDLPRSDMEI